MALSDNRRIAKNTLMLYFRQILIMLVSLYTVRVVLETLGAEDYGIYNVVAGVVVLFSFVNNAMASSTQRFLNFELGKKNIDTAKNIYSISLLIHIVIAVVFIVLSETVGLWFVVNKLNIPIERHTATLWVYQFTILTTVVNIIRTPYHAVIIAYEKMSFFAKISILEACLKLGVVFLLVVSSSDKLIFYSLLLCIVSFFILLLYKIYCNKYFVIAHFSKPKEKKLAGELISFSGWSLLGAVANVSNSQGTNIVLNMFTNVTVNAAMGIANQVNSAVYSFVGNFQTAFNPQIVKTYASGNYSSFISLICRTAKFSFFLLLFIILPLYLNIEFVLTVWLKDVPEYLVEFVKLMLIWSLIDSLNGPLWMSVQATGNIKKYQITASILIFFNLPLSLLAFLAEASPLWILYIRIALSVITTFWRIFFLKKKILLPVFRFFQVMSQCIFVTVCSVFCTISASCFFDGIQYFFMSCASSVIFTLIAVMIFGLNKVEKQLLIEKLTKLLKRNYEQHS